MSGPIGTRVDAGLTLLFGRHAESPRHAASRQRFRATAGSRSFVTFVGRLYALSWVVFGLVTLSGLLVLRQVPVATLDPAVRALGSLPLVDPNRAWVAVTRGGPLVVGLLGKRGTVRAGEALLAHRARRRRMRIEHSLPRAVRFMHVLASGTADERTLLTRVADRERAFGETARSFQRVLGTASVTGSVDGALRIVARDTPSRQTLAPFLLTFRARAREGPTDLARFLHLESRTLAKRDARRTGDAKRYLGVVLQSFVALLVLPAVGLIGIALLTGLGYTDAVPDPGLATAVRSHVVLSPASALLVLVLGALASGLVAVLRPAGYRWSRYCASSSFRALLTRAPWNPTNAFVLLSPLGVVVAVWLWGHGTTLVDAALLGYAAFAVPVGLVDWRRARLDAAKDRYLPELIYGVARQVHLGRSFTRAVANVADDGRLGPLNDDVADLAFDLQVATTDRPVRGAALERFVDRVGTPLAERTVGMIAGALDAGSRTAAAFDALQSEAGRLYHEERAVKDRMPVVVAVGWVASLLVVGVVVAIDVAAVGSTVPATGSAGPSGATASETVRTAAGLPTYYLLTQATMLSSGWFAGVAGRGVYEGLLHSGALVVAAFLAFVGTGLL